MASEIWTAKMDSLAVLVVNNKTVQSLERFGTTQTDHSRIPIRMCNFSTFSSNWNIIFVQDWSKIELEW